MRFVGGDRAEARALVDEVNDWGRQQDREERVQGAPQGVPRRRRQGEGSRPRLLGVHRVEGVTRGNRPGRSGVCTRTGVNERSQTGRRSRDDAHLTPGTLIASRCGHDEHSAGSAEPLPRENATSADAALIRSPAGRRSSTTGARCCAASTAPKSRPPVIRIELDGRGEGALVRTTSFLGRELFTAFRHALGNSRWLKEQNANLVKVADLGAIVARLVEHFAIDAPP